MRKIAAIQMVSKSNVNANLVEASKLIQHAVDVGASFIVLPENFGYMGFSDSERLHVAEENGHGIMQDFLSKQASTHHIWLLGGTIPIKATAQCKVRSASLLFNDTGNLVARYDKIHLFDVTVDDIKRNYYESKAIEPGTEIVVAETPFGEVGLSVCYDIRFPELYRQCSEQGATIFAVPSAFTAVTGAAHWEVLLRARAIENLCYVIAAGQVGTHENGRETYGHSMIVNPWGKILAEKTSGSGIVVAEINVKEQQQIRQQFPVLEHRKLDKICVDKPQRRHDAKTPRRQEKINRVVRN